MKASGEDRVAEDLGIGEFFAGQTPPLRCASDGWGWVDRGTRVSVVVGCTALGLLSSLTEF